jgi:hypothetical protein
MQTFSWRFMSPLSKRAIFMASWTLADPKGFLLSRSACCRERCEPFQPRPGAGKSQSGLPCHFQNLRNRMMSPGQRLLAADPDFAPDLPGLPEVVAVKGAQGADGLV